MNMLIWLAMIIPILTLVVLFLFFRHKTSWWEFIVPVIVSIICIVGCKLTSYYSATLATEYWTNYVVKAEYYEEWDEEETEIVTVDDGNGKSHTETRTHTVTHPPEWKATLNDNETVISISQELYDELSQRWKNNVFVDMHRHYHTKDGDKYETEYNKDESKMEVIVTSHSYVNKVKASSSIFKFKEVDKDTSMVYDYPVLADFYMPSIIGNAKYKDTANRLLDIANAKYGMSKECRMFMLLFKNQPLQVAIDQENYWKGGNKNELVICLGLNNTDEIDWCYVFSWSEKDRMKVNLRNFAIEMKPFNLVEYTKFAIEEMKAQFTRKNWSDFDYLTVDVSGFAVAMTFLITILVNLGLSIWIIFNQFEGEENGRKKTVSQALSSRFKNRGWSFDSRPTLDQWNRRWRN